MGCFHGQAIGDCLACDIDDVMRDVYPDASRDRLVAKAIGLIEAIQEGCRYPRSCGLHSSPKECLASPMGVLLAAERARADALVAGVDRFLSTGLRADMVEAKIACAKARRL